MRQVGKVTGLIRRGSTYSLRRRVPSDLVDALNRREVVIALGTSDYKTAERQARLASVRLDVQWEGQRKALKRGEKISSDDVVSEADLRRVVLGDFWSQEQDAIALRGADDEVRSAYEIDLFCLLAGDPAADSALLAKARSLIQGGKLKIPVPEKQVVGTGQVPPFQGSAELGRLLELLRRAETERLRRVLDRIDGQHGDFSHDPLFDNINSVSMRPATSDVLSLGEAIRRMETDPTRAHLGDTADAKYVMTFRAMKEVIGADKALSTITRADCAAVQELIASIPANVAKLKAYKQCKTLRC